MSHEADKLVGRLIEIGYPDPRQWRIKILAKIRTTEPRVVMDLEKYLLSLSASYGGKESASKYDSKEGVLGVEVYFPTSGDAEQFMADTEDYVFFQGGTINLGYAKLYKT